MHIAHYIHQTQYNWLSLTPIGTMVNTMTFTHRLLALVCKICSLCVIVGALSLYILIL